MEKKRPLRAINKGGGARDNLPKKGGSGFNAWMKGFSPSGLVRNRSHKREEKDKGDGPRFLWGIITACLKNG